MFKNTYQNGLLSIFYSCGSNPLAIWDMEVQNGHIKRVTDNEVNSIVLEIIMILDDQAMRRRFRISNFQSTTKIKPFCTTMPIGLSGGWNQIQFNLADFTRRAYGTQFIETLRIQVHANTRLRRIYFCDRLYTEEELPHDYKLYLPIDRKIKKGKETKNSKTKDEQKEEIVKAAPAAPPSIAEQETVPPSEPEVESTSITPAAEVKSKDDDPVTEVTIEDNEVLSSHEEISQENAPSIEDNPTEPTEPELVHRSTEELKSGEVEDPSSVKPVTEDDAASMLVEEQTIENEEEAPATPIS